MWGQIIVCHGGVLCFVGSVAASLASPHDMPVPPTYLVITTQSVSTLFRRSLPRPLRLPVENHGRTGIQWLPDPEQGVCVCVWGGGQGTKEVTWCLAQPILSSLSSSHCGTQTEARGHIFVLFRMLLSLTLGLNPNRQLDPPLPRWSAVAMATEPFIYS